MKHVTQEERLDYLVEEFKTDYNETTHRTVSMHVKASGEYRCIEMPKDTEGKRRVLRSLMNIRMPRNISSDVLRIQDEYLKGRSEEKGIITSSDIPEIRKGLSIWQGDITRLSVDAIVNAANSQMLGCFVPMHTCIDKAAPTSITQEYNNSMARCS